MKYFIFIAFLTAVPFSSQGADVAYVSVAGEKRIVVYDFDAKSGALSRRSENKTNGEPGALAVDPSKRFLFASLRSTGHLTSYSIDQATGELMPISEVPAGADPAFVATDRSGKYLLCAYYRAGKVTVHRIGSDGSLSLEPLQSIETDEKAHAILTDRSNQFAYVPHTGPNAIFQFRFDDATGRLEPLWPDRVRRPRNTGPRHLAFHPSQEWVYSDNEQESSVTVYELQEQGTLSAFQSVSTLPEDFEGQNSNARLEITADGKFVYASNRGHDSIAGFSVDAKTGKLTSIGQFPTETTPRAFSIHPSGKYLLAAGQGSGKLAMFRIDQGTGRLTRIGTYPVGARPWWVLVL